jgi:membrane-bound lytic murein transglycosylase B
LFFAGFKNVDPTQQRRTGAGKKRSHAAGRLLAAGISLVIIGCSAAPSETAQGSLATPSEPAFAAIQGEPALTFAQWINLFRSEALSRGISPSTFDQAFTGVTLNQSVLEASERQPEFERQIWTYLDLAVSESRINTGRRLLTVHRSLLQEIQRTYHVQPNYLVAIWGLESNFGSKMGSLDIVEGLATIAYRGRRKDYARKELMALLTILENGYARRSQLHGSWAGAVGQTQFIPSAYLEYAVDYDGDGRRDIWTNLGDVFASTANYLAKWNWQPGHEWGREIALPVDFDYSLADTTIVKSVAAWLALGIQAATGSSLDGERTQIASIILPGGYQGPAFLIYQNFRTILRYNNSSAYALAIGHLADRLNGGPVLKGAWPVHEAPLSRFEREDMQQRLTILGYEPGTVDGIVGPRTRSALRRFQANIGVPADGFPTQKLLARLRQETISEPRTRP